MCKSGTFFNGMVSGENVRASRLYDKVAMGGGAANYILANKALRALAELDGKTPRECVRSLPLKSWNSEP